MSIEYRLLGPDDLSVLQNTADGVFDHEPVPDMTARFLADPAHLIAVAVDAGTVVGMATGNEYLHPDKPVQFWINEMGVAPGHQRQGIGKKLLSLMLQEARRRGFAEVWLATEDDNLPARALYRSTGGQEENCVVYTFKLDPP